MYEDTRPGEEICDKCGEAHPYDLDEDHGWSRRTWCAEVVDEDEV